MASRLAPFHRRGRTAIEFYRLSNKRWGTWSLPLPVKRVLDVVCADGVFNAFDYDNGLGDVCTHQEGYELERVRLIDRRGRGVWVRTYGRWVLLTPSSIA